jgi:hypothetical protein
MRTPLRSHSRRLAVGLALALAASAACNLQIGTGVEAREDWTRTYSVRPGATLDLRETNGKIRVEATAGDRLEVTAIRIAKGPTDEAARAALGKFSIGETATAERVEIDSSTHGLQLTLGASLRVDYEIRAPRSLNVTIKTTNGTVEVQGIEGALAVDAVNGSVLATGLGGSANVSAINGKLDLAFVKLGDAGIRCKTTNGQIVVTIPSTAKATIAARVQNGLIRTENLTLEAGEDSRRRLDATIGGGGPEIRLEATNGEVRPVGK